MANDPVSKQEQAPLGPAFALLGGCMTSFMALSFAMYSSTGPDLVRAASLIASGLCALGACIVFGLLAVASVLNRRG